MRHTLASILIATALVAPAFADEPAKPGSKPTATEAPPDPEQLAREKAFTERMTNAVMVGQWSDGKAAPKGDKYTIESVQKMPGKGDTWVFNARIQFGGKDVTIPLPVPVKWAGDTPVISVTDFGIPGLGTYTARVLIYNDTYAGTWSGGDHGGYMWGKIEKAKPADIKPAGAKPADAPKNNN
ncbi:MAG TPA: hypothetical protein VK986_08280 [Tepidisphaeraceae bacterium]|nr:hypothetical protein [Tepidisphaeraceae bacterium]